MWRFWLACGVVGALLLLGCDDPAQPPPPAAKVPTTQAVQASTKQPPTTRPDKSFVTVDGAQLTFPGARLQIIKRDEKNVAVLFSNDPPEAIRPNYNGNSYYLEMPIEVEPAELPSDEWAYKAPNSEQTDTPNGIFLDGLRVHLQPMDVRVSFEGDLSEMTVIVHGMFLAFRNDARDTAGEMLPVSAKLPVVPEVK